MSSIAARILLLFFYYSFLGWCVESAICSVNERKLINRGFLNGPLCPVYGVGAIGCIYLLLPLREHLVILYIASTLLVSVIEYFTGWLLETIFHTRWWDYSHYRFNLKGRVCLPNAFFFGLLGIFTVHILQPAAAEILSRLSDFAALLLGVGVTAVFVADLIVSVRTALQLSGKLQEVQETLTEARTRAQAAIQEGRLQAALFANMTREEKRAALEELGVDPQLLERLDRLSQGHSILHRRMLDAFPHMQFPRSPAALETLRGEIERFRIQHKAARKNSGKNAI